MFPSGIKKRGGAKLPKDSYVFIGDPPDELSRPKADYVHVSCTFTWDRLEAERLKLAWSQYYYNVKIGGPVYGDRNHDGFIPGKYIMPGITFTSSGCGNNCPWCLEGDFYEYLDFQPGHIIQDANFLLCGKAHISRVFEMLRYQNKAVSFSGGLDSRLITDWFIDELKTVNVDQLFFACDTENAIKPLRKAIQRIQLPRDKVRCYVLLKFNENETIEKAESRLMEVWEAGAMPFAQLYQPTDEYIKYSWTWRNLQRNWSRPAITKIIANKELDI